MNSINKVYQRIGNRKFWAISGVVLILLALIAFLLTRGEEEINESGESQSRAVEMIAVSDYRTGAIGYTAPTADGNSFVVRAESSGRINRVSSVKEVRQGTVIAQIDNAAEAAALLQAQGVYEAALAAAGRADINTEDAANSLLSAKQSAVNSIRSALTLFNTTLFNTVDELFSNPRTNIPGVRINAGGSSAEISNERVALGKVLTDWQREIENINPEQSTGQLSLRLEQAISRIDQLNSLVGTFIDHIPKHGTDEIFTPSEINRLQNSFSTARVNLNNQRAALEEARVSLSRAEDAVRNAELGGTGREISSANAQIKQALGAYRSAQDTYEKTIVRAPFAGSVVAINVKVGDFVNYGSDIAIITPKEGEVTETSFVLPISSVKFSPDGAFVYTVDENNEVQSVAIEAGLVTSSSIKVSGLTGGETIIKDVRGLKVGDKVAAQ